MAVLDGRGAVLGLRRLPGRHRTHELVDRTVPLVVPLIGLSRFRLLRSSVEDVLALLADLRR